MGEFKARLKETGSVLAGFRGNARAMLLTEPFFGIPHNLYSTYVSVYMIALGCSYRQIGLITSVGLACQLFFSLISGYVTDKIGRKRSTLIFDLIGWSIPALISASARNFYYFLVAAIVNSIFRIEFTSFDCLLVEDTPRKQRVHVYTWMHVTGILAGFFTPLGGLLVGALDLVPAMRIIYVFAFFCMTAAFLSRNALVRETDIGFQKMKESRGLRPGMILDEYKRMAIGLLRDPRLLLVFLVSLLGNIRMTLRQAFLSILLTSGLGFSAKSIAIFPAVHSGVMLLIFVFFMPLLSKSDPKRPIIGGLLLSAAGYLILIFAAGPSYLMIFTSTVLSAAGTAVVSPFVRSLLANSIKDEDRAKVLSILNVLLLASTVPFGYIGGTLSAISERLPFLLIVATLAISLLLVLALKQFDNRYEVTQSDR